VHNDQTVTQLLQAADAGDSAAFEQLYARTYDELRRLAHRVRQSNQQTLNTTALVHEAYLKLVPGTGLLARDRIHFFRIAARAMRQVLVDAARRRATRDRGNLLLYVEAIAGTAERLSLEVLDLENALVELEALSPRQANVVECRFFAGLSVEETAEALGVSSPTVKREWRIARAWLAQALGGGPQTRTTG
jgi:RNA polymerase sigma factor (TIGR02999 family)